MPIKKPDKEEIEKTNNVKVKELTVKNSGNEIFYKTGKLFFFVSIFLSIIIMSIFLLSMFLDLISYSLWYSSARDASILGLANIIRPIDVIIILAGSFLVLLLIVVAFTFLMLYYNKYYWKQFLGIIAIYEFMILVGLVIIPLIFYSNIDYIFSAGAIFIGQSIISYFYRIIPYSLGLIGLAAFAVSLFLLNAIFNNLHNDYGIKKTRIFSQFGVLAILALRILLAIIGSISENSNNLKFLAVVFFFNPAINIITGFIIIGINIELFIKIRKLPLKTILY